MVLFALLGCASLGGIMDSKFRYSPALDGFRAGAVLLVMVYHLGVPPRGGHIGVNAFFVLSGFLITSLLLQENLKSGRIALGSFFARRALRLYPPLIAVVLAVAVYSMLVPGAVRGDSSLAAIPAVLLYFSNWVRSFGEGTPLGLFEHTWSLSVEEQFYLLWPLILLAVLRLTRRLWVVVVVALAGCLAALLLRLALNGTTPGERITSGIDTQADQLLFGCALAAVVLMASRRGWGESLSRVMRVAVWPAALVLGVAAVAWKPGDYSVLGMIIPAIVAAACAVVIGFLYLNPSARMTRVLGCKPLVYVGKRSYALYLWHYPIYTVMTASNSPANGPLRMAAEVALSFVAAELSWRLVESPVLRLKDRLITGRKADAPSVPSMVNS
jgi:peptidoglycan/LPS O-acetylase OafA/YrhL